MLWVTPCCCNVDMIHSLTVVHALQARIVYCSVGLFGVQRSSGGNLLRCEDWPGLRADRHMECVLDSSTVQ